ncbi:MAG: hypothetical protein ABIL58_03520 [Pseudomonadota bacterium]
MAKSDEISSTEKLLELIRDRGGGAVDNTDAVEPFPESETEGKPAPTILSSKIPVTIGVDIRSTAILLAAVLRGVDGRPELSDFKKVALKTHMIVDSADFIRTLGAALSDFTSGYKKYDIWVSMSSANVEMRLLKIPQIPARQIPNAAKWSFRRETPLDEVRDVFDYHVLGLIFDEGVQKTRLLAYTAPRAELKQLQTAFQKSGFSLTGVSIVPFAIQNLIKAGWIDPGGKTACTLFVGKDWSRIAIYADGNLILGRDIKAGVHSIVEAIAENMRPGASVGSTHSVDLQPQMPEGNPFVPQSDTAAGSQLLIDFLKDQLSAHNQSGRTFSKAQVFEMIAAPLERIIRQVAMTIEHYASHYDSSGVSKVFISGDIAGHPWVARQISKHLDLPVEAMEPFSQRPATDQSIPTPETLFERMAYLPAVGTALSDNATTPNFLFTHKEKNQIRQSRQINRIAYSAFGLLFTILVVVIFWQTKAIITVKNEVIPMRKELESLSPKLDRTMVSQLAGDLVRRMKVFSVAAQRYIGAAVLTDVVNRTPATISLSTTTIDLGEVSTTSIKTSGRFVLINGFVATERNALETTLANYLAELRASPLLGQPEMKKQSVESLNGQNVLQFTVTVPIK